MVLLAVRGGNRVFVIEIVVKRPVDKEGALNLLEQADIELQPLCTLAQQLIVYNAVFFKEAAADDLGICDRDIAVVDQELLLQPPAFSAPVDLSARRIVAQIEFVILRGMLIFPGDPAHDQVDLLPGARLQHLLAHVGVDPVISVHKHDPLAAGGGKTGVPGTAEPPVLLVEHTDPGIPLRILVADLSALVR